MEENAQNSSGSELDLLQCSAGLKRSLECMKRKKCLGLAMTAAKTKSQA